MKVISLSAAMLIGCVASAEVLTLEIPIEYAGHGLTFTNSGTPFQPVWDGYNANGSHLRYAWEAPLDVSLGVINATTGSTYHTTFQVPYALRKTITPEQLKPQNGSTMFAFAVEEVRLNNTLGVVLETYQWAFPVTKTGIVGYNLSNSSGQSTWNSLGFFDVLADTGMTIGPDPKPRLIDLTRNEQSRLGITNLLSDGWEPLTIPLPQRNVVIKVPYEPNPRFFYTLHTSSETLTSIFPVTNQTTGETTVSGAVGIGQNFWLSRQVDGATSSQVFATIGNTTIHADFSDMPAPPQESYQTLAFTIGHTHGGETFKVRYWNGTETWLSYAGNGSYTTWDYWGNMGEYGFTMYECSVDVSVPWSLIGTDGTNEVDYGGTTTLTETFQPFNPAPPSGTESVILPLSRREAALAGHIRRQYADGSQWAVTVDPAHANPGAELSYDVTVFAGQPDERTYTVWYVPAYAPTSSGGGNWWIYDESVGDISGMNTPDASLWYTPPSPIQLTLPVTRWNHELYLRTGNGASYPIQPGVLQGLWQFTGSGSSFQSHGYFSASSQYHPEATWWVWDATTGELSPSGQTNLSSWASYADNWDDDADGLPNWYEYLIGTSPDGNDGNEDGMPDGYDTDGDGVNDRDEMAQRRNPNTPPPFLSVTTPANAVLY